MTPPTAHELGLRYRAERRAERELVRSLRNALYRRMKPGDETFRILLARADCWLERDRE